MATRSLTRAVATIGATALFSVGLLVVGSAPAFAAGQTFVVTEATTTFGAPQPGELSWAIEQANATAGADTIDIHVATITLDEDLPAITDEVTILGNGNSVDATLIYTVFNFASVSGAISDITVTGPDSAGVTAAPDAGGTIVLTNVNVSGATSSTGITISTDAGETVRVVGGTLSANNVGMAITASGGGTIDIAGTTVSNNAGLGIDITTNGTPTITMNKVTVDGNNDTSIGINTALYDDTTLTISNSTVTGCTDQAVYVLAYGDSHFTLNADSSVSNNFGLGIFVYTSATVVIDQTTVAENDGTGINLRSAYDDASFTLSNSTMSGNRGLGVSVDTSDTAVAEITSSTISGNLDRGVSVISESAFRLRNSTVTNNGYDGVYLENTGDPALISHTIVSGNHTAVAPNSDLVVSGADVAVEWSIVGTFEDSAPSALDEGDGVQWNVADPGLGALAANGGSTQTHLLSATSPALDAGNPAIVSAPTTDQRGLARVYGAAIDIGALETQAALPALAATGIEIVWPLGGTLLLFIGGAVLMGRRARVVR